MKVTFDAPEELVAEIRRRAAGAERSVAGEVRVALRHHTASPLERSCSTSSCSVCAPAS